MAGTPLFTGFQVEVSQAAGKAEEGSDGGRGDDVTDRHDVFSNLGFIRESPDILEKTIIRNLFWIT